MTKTVFQSDEEGSFVSIQQEGFLWWKSYHYFVVCGYEVRSGTRYSFVDALASALAAVKVLGMEEDYGA